MSKDIYLTLTFLLTITSFVIVGSILGYDSSVYAGRASVNISKPVINDSNLTVDLVFSGLKKPTSMIFLGIDDVLVAQKNEGTVERIVNGVKNIEPLVTVPVASKDERGLLGMAISKDPFSKKNSSISLLH